MTYLRNYAVLNVKDRLARIEGVGQVQLFGSGDYSMRVWLDPQKVARARPVGQRRGARDPRAERAGRGRRGRRLAGPAGHRPAAARSTRRAGCRPRRSSATSSSRPSADGARHAPARRRAHRARRRRLLAALAARQQARGRRCRSSRRRAPTRSQISDDVRATMAEIKKNMPEGVDYEIVYDPTQFVRASIEAVVHTLLEAIALVVLVVILFLQTWRASIIPLLAVPVSIVGTFARDAPVRLLDQRADACSAWCWRSASSSTTRSSWWRTSSATSRRACRRARRPTARCARCRARSSRSRWCWSRCSCRSPSSAA